MPDGMQFLCQFSPFKSMAQVRRTVSQGGVSLNGTKLTSNDLISDLNVQEGDVLKIGKRIEHVVKKDHLG